MKVIGILGSTGSIGTQTLSVVRELNARPETVSNPHISIAMLSAGRNRDLILKQSLEFRPKTICLELEEDSIWLAEEIKKSTSNYAPTIVFGGDGLIFVASQDMDILVTAIVGMRGLRPTMAAIEHGTTIALANKETLVAAGSIVMKAAREHNVEILPVDSEHSAIFQSLMASGKGGHGSLRRIMLTASGGPFRGQTIDQLSKVTLESALKHPTWKMGGKITIDCASMMNKGLEVIEAMHLFDVPVDDIQVVVHPESIVHSLVMFEDGSVIGQLGNPDMKVPIQLAITYPYRAISETKPLDLTEIGRLNFEKPDTKTFKCLALAIRAAKRGGSMPAVMNAANEEAVRRFLAREISFTDIAEIVERVMDAHERNFIENPTLDDILRVSATAQEEARSV